MADLQTGPQPTAEQRQKASASKLRSLARTGLDVRSFLRNITAIEIAAMVGLLGLIATVFVIYFASILPDQVRRLQLSNEVTSNRTKIDELRAQAGDPGAVTAAYQQVHESLDAFRGQTLQPRTAGRLQIIGLVNDLTRETNVVLDGPISFDARNPLDEAVDEKDGKGKRKTRKSEDEIQTYPSLGISMTISGSYPQIRAFLAKFETSRQFAIIDSVSISSEEESDDSEGSGTGRRSTARADSGAITLDISMTAFFQPDGTVAAATTAGGSRPGAP